MKKRPTTAKRIEPAIKREKAATGWNMTTVPESKFFDKSIDKDYLRKKTSANVS